MYADFPIGCELLLRESQSNASVASETGQNLIHHADCRYAILIFARDQKRRNGCTIPFTYLDDAKLLSFESERPIKIIWRLRHPMASRDV